MDRRTLIAILIVLAIVAAGIWVWRLRATQYPKEYMGEQPAGPGAPMKQTESVGVAPGAMPE